MERDYIANKGRFILKDYNRKPPFANFLPAISGVWGVPLWAFYTNRGQGISSFGVNDKNHSILEFFPANQAYQLTSVLGFRTFIKKEREFYEPFSPENNSLQTLYASSYDLKVEDINTKKGLKFSARYFTLPEENVGALVRVLTVKNLLPLPVKLEIIDGLPKIVPFGSNEYNLKYISRTIEAWIRTQIIHTNIGVFRLIVDPKDVAETKFIEGANFYAAFSSRNDKIRIIADSAKIFGPQATLEKPHYFFQNNFRYSEKQMLFGKTPSAFSYAKINLAAGEEISLYSLIGSAFRLEDIEGIKRFLNVKFLEKKEERNREIITEIKQKSFVCSRNDKFDHYVTATYLDNILRGGYPYKREKQIYYVFSRKHGDLERDYNHFRVRPTYFSFGEANYRDINQNRRIDLFFEPAVYKRNVVNFINLLKIDGYNPLIVKGEKLFLRNQDIKKLLSLCRLPSSLETHSFFKEGFYLGDFFQRFLSAKRISLKEKEKIAGFILSSAVFRIDAEFGEGYWIDHWRYNTDLLENFLYFYPDKLKELMLDTEFHFWDDEWYVPPRFQRYFAKEGKVFQKGHLLRSEKKYNLIKTRKTLPNFLRSRNGLGEIYSANLAEKLLVLVLNKSATLDAFGCGIEMEAAKPGWCDSLNGLPALFGSSLIETIELARLAKFLKSSLEEIASRWKISQLRLSNEVYVFFDELEKLTKQYLSRKTADKDIDFWDKSNSLKETFRQQTFFGPEGFKKTVSIEKITGFLHLLIKKLSKAIEKSQDKTRKIPYSYFIYSVSKFTKVGKTAIKPLKFKRIPLPLFLEAPVSYLRIAPLAKRRRLYANVRRSALFDKKIKMYKLNENLSSMPLEIGRSRVFPRGWLENESIWLHMEYKYLLELVKSGLYKEFYKEFENLVVCFFLPQRYKRSIYENSSFIVSSAYLDKNMWGQGFVARLTGATAEFLNIFMLMCLGNEPFFLDRKGNLAVSLKPVLKKDFFTKKKKTIKLSGKEFVLAKNSFSFYAFSSTLITYYNFSGKDTYSPHAKIRRIVLTTRQGKAISLTGEVIPAPYSYDFREGKYERVEANFE